MKPENIYLTLEDAVRINEQIENILRDLKDELMKIIGGIGNGGFNQLPQKLTVGYLQGCNL